MLDNHTSETLCAEEGLSIDGAVSCEAIQPEKRISKFGWGGPRANSGGARPGAGRKPTTPRQAEIVTKPIGLRWYVVETHPQAERRAVYDLARQGWRAYLPLIAVRVRDRVMPTMIHKDFRPLFAGFVFCEFDRDSLTWGTIREYCNGVRGIIRQPGSDKPAPLPPQWIERLMAGDAERLELAATVNPARSQGDKVVISVGPMTALPGVVASCDGLTTTVDVELFGRTVQVSMGWDQVEAVG